MKALAFVLLALGACVDGWEPAPHRVDAGEELPSCADVDCDDTQPLTCSGVDGPCMCPQVDADPVRCTIEPTP